MKGNRVIRWLRRWGPAAVVTIAVAAGATVYHEQLAEWFGVDDGGLAALFSKAGGSSSAPGHAHGSPQPAADAANHAHDNAVAFWTCPMHPSVRAKDKGACPICKMDLTPVTFEEVRSGVILVDAKRRQTIGLTTAKVAEQSLHKTIRAVGIVTYDETRLTDVTLKYDGWIGDLYADATGKHVTRGEPLLTIYSPDLYTAQQEYLDALGAGGAPARSSRVTEAARERLLLWDVTLRQVDELARRGTPQQYLPVLAPADGTIIRKVAVKGGAVRQGEVIYRLADLSRLWIEAELFEDEAPLVQPGMRADIDVSYLPGKSFQGEVAFAYPYLDPQTRRGRIRIELPNERNLLRPDMYVTVRFSLPIGTKLAIPEKAVVYGGENNVVFLDIGEGRLRPQRVKLGLRAAAADLGDDLIEVVEGLKPGDTIVTSGNFLIASESKLKSGIEKW